jgi:mannose-6-phosphate isomerase-like protein (cupin superfamily)
VKDHLDRRNLCRSLAAFTALAASTRRGNAESEGEATLNHSQLFPYDKLVAHPSPNGGSSRAVIEGTLATGEFVEVHETILQPGMMPHPPHRHTHSEFLLIREGRLEVDSDGQRGIVEPGGVVFTASGVLHGLKNVGTIPANYFVVAVGIQKTIP